MGIEDILRKNDEKRGRGNLRQGATERGEKACQAFYEFVALALVAAVKGLRDPALGEPVHLPLGTKTNSSQERAVLIECQGLVRFTLHCMVRTDLEGTAYCSAIDLGMSRGGGRSVRGTYEPLRGSSGRPNKLGVTDKQFLIDPPRFLKAIESLAHQL